MSEEMNSNEQPTRPQDAAALDDRDAPTEDLVQDVASAGNAGSQELAAELIEANNRALRAQAELENFRKRMRREMDEQERYAASPLIRELLGVIDDLQRAIEAAEKSEDKEGLLAGVKMVESRLRVVLEQHGCRRIEAAAEQFDPALHEAILHQPSAGHEPGEVMQVTQQGYQLHDRVLRPAQVIVAKVVAGKEASSE